VLAELAKHPWGMFAAWAGIIAAIGFLWVNFGRPYRRHLRLKHPCEVHFQIRAVSNRVQPYARQDSLGHRVRELVLPANSEVEIEIGCVPKLAFSEKEQIFGCEGDLDKKPYAKEWIVHFVERGMNRGIPGVHDGHTLNVHKGYHRRTDTTRNVGTHFVTGFRLVTRAPGRYKTQLFFITDEREGVADLTIVVEDSPETCMVCDQHWECGITPARIPFEIR
jgi:hypothetical protein